MRCPHCRSYDVSRFVMLWKAGTSEGRFDGGSIGSSTTTALFSQTIYGRISNQTRLAQECAPPEPPAASGYVWAVVALWLITVLLIGFYKNVMASHLATLLPEDLIAALFNLLATILSLSLLVAFGLIAYEKYKNEKLEYENSYREWENLWLCLRCGCAFTE